MKLREGVKKNINYLAGIFYGRGGGEPAIHLNNEFFPNKIRALQTVLNGLKHEKINKMCFPIMTPLQT